jgi:DNA (cytosine-5)-methyltransferase 1
MNQTYKVGELFSGIGGIGLGFKNAGFEIAWANEIDSNACRTYAKNFEGVPIIKEDIRKIDAHELENVDILTGGFPCQAFSIASNQKGFGDNRGTLFFEILRIINILKPKDVFLENVKNLASHDNGKTFKIIQQKLKEAGYSVQCQVLNTAHYSNIPQNRERIYKDKNVSESFKFPKKTNKRKSTQELIDKTVGDIYYYTNTKYYPQLKKEMEEDDDAIYQWRRVYVRKNESGLCPTLTANMGGGGHNVPIV